MKAIILIKTEAGKAFSVNEKISKIDGVNLIHVVTGMYDVIALADYNTISPRGLIESIHDIDGVTSTETCVALY